MNSIFHRTSIRKYQEKPVEREKTEQLLRAAMAAPSACNQQPWEFYAVTDPETVCRLAACSPYAGAAAKAPLVIVPCWHSEGIAPEYFQIDMSAATENLLLEADALGLGAVWMGIAPEEERMEAVRRVLSLPAGVFAFALVPCGCPAEEKTQEDRFDANRVHFVG